MKKNTFKNDEAAVLKVFDPQAMRADAAAILKPDCEPDSILKKLDAKLSQLADKNVDLAQDKEAQKILGNASMVLGLDTHHALIWAMKEDFRPLAIEFANNLAKEFNCKTPGEKALSHVVVNSYVRLIDDSRRYSNCADAGEYLSVERTKHLAMLSKQIDRANRQFITALITLKQLKEPALKVNIKANNAFVAQNQQLNTKVNENDTL
jgi:hypothetical protein